MRCLFVLCCPFTVITETIKIECPTGSGKLRTFDVAQRSLSASRCCENSGPLYERYEEIGQTDPQWKDYVLFFEYFHGDNSAGHGAMHQTGWTGLVGKLIEIFSRLNGLKFLEAGRAGAFKAERTEEVEVVAR